MKKARRIVLGLVVAAVVAVGGAWALARSTSPAVPLDRDAENEDEAALREVIREIGDPRELEEGDVITVRLDPNQASAIAAEASRRIDVASARVLLRDEGVEVTVAARSPRPSITPYVNLTATLSGPPSAPAVESATVGSLPIGAALGQRLFDMGYALAREREPVLAAVADAVDSVEYGADEITVTVHWTEAVRERLRDAGRGLIGRELGGEGLLAQTEALRGALEALPEGEVRLSQLTPAVFASAQERVEAGADARRELEAGLVVLGMYALEHPLSDVLGERAPQPLPPRSVLLHGRDDLAKHFLVSAISAALGDRAFADALGLAKELEDAEAVNGSGFSFRDLAADRAGVRLIEGTSDEQIAARLARLAQPTEDADLVPYVEDLPEGMDAAAFEAAYENVDSEAYRSLVARIDARITECAVHR